jgi:DNA-binding LytR/AlgR family response regulator
VRVLIADDEAPARRLLARLVEQLGSDVVGEVDSGLAVLAAVGTAAPDVILLDIHMPELDGLELAARYPHLPPVVFVTTHDEHAVRAFELGAVDYLLKPVRLERLAAALHRALARRAIPAVPAPAPAVGVRYVTTRDGGTIRVFDIASIDRFHATDKYTVFHVDGAEHVIEESLTALEQRLRSHDYLRVHRGELVKLTAIASLVSDGDGYFVLLRSGERVPVSRRSVSAVKGALGIGSEVKSR